MAEPDNAEMRASDADREAVAERLRTAQDEGRLSLAEYDERLRTAYAAVTMAELTELTADLPSANDLPSAKQVPERTPPEKGMARPFRKLPQQWQGYVRVSIILIAVWVATSAASGEVLFFWPIFPLGIWGAVLLSNSMFGHRSCGSDDKRDDKGNTET